MGLLAALATAWLLAGDLKDPFAPAGAPDRPATALKDPFARGDREVTPDPSCPGLKDPFAAARGRTCAADLKDPFPVAR